jgi:protease-4
MTIGTVITGILGLIWRILDGLRKTLHLILLLLLFGIVIAALQTSIPIVPGNAALLLNPQGRIVEQLSGDPFEQAFTRATSATAPETLLRDILDALEAAATDKRIKLVVLDLQHMEGAGLSKLQEIGAAMEKFRASGKKIIAVADYYDQGAYYLAAHADEIYADPLGGVFIEGFSHYGLYFKEALEKLGVDMNIFKVGTHKSAMEPFTRTDMSAEEREQSLAWLDVLWQAYQGDVIRARQLPADALARYVADAVPRMRAARGNAAQVALDSGLITAIRSREQLNVEMQELVGKDERSHLYRRVDLGAYVAATHAERKLKRRGGQQIAVVVASGEILDGPQSPGTIGGESLARVIRDARDNADIKAMVLRIDSPGGSMLASEQIYRELQAFRKTGRPVIASMSSVAASGGYYIAMGADEVWASPTTITGSIGVFAVLPTFQDTLKKLGVTVDGVGTTELSGQLRLDRPLSPAARALLQSGIEHAYAEFLQRVADNRDASAQDIDAVAQGRVWAGADAKAQGLVDGLGRLQDAVSAAALRAKLGEDYQLSYLEPQVTWQESLGLNIRAAFGRVAAVLGLGRFFEDRSPAILRQVTDPLERELKRWARFNDPRGLYSYCFCAIG